MKTNNIIKKELINKIKRKVSHIVLGSTILLFTLILLVMFSSLVYGAFEDGMFVKWDFTENVNDTISDNDLENNGVTITSNGGDFESTESDYLELDQGMLLTNSSGEEHFTLAITFKPESLSGTTILYDEHQSEGIILRITDTGGGVYKLNSWIDNTGNEWDTELSAGIEYRAVWTYRDDTDYHEFWLDNTISSEGVVTKETGYSDNSVIRLGVYAHVLTGYYDGLIKEVCLWDRKLNTADKQIFMDYGCDGEPLPRLYIQNNLQNTENYNNDSLTLTWNISRSNIPSGCLEQNSTIYINDIPNITLVDNKYATYSDFGDLLNYTLDTSNKQETWDISLFVTCDDSQTNVSSSVYEYKIDTVNPMIDTDFINNTEYYLLDTREIYVNFTDENLFAYNISIFDLNGIEEENYFAENLTVTFAENRTSKVITDIGDLGNYRLRFQVWDSHTTNKIKNYKIDKLKNGVEIEDKIKIITENTDINLIKNKDRYNFDLDIKKENPIINIECNDLRYLSNSKYKGHFVCFEDKKWIDFEDKNNVKIKINKLNNNNAEIQLITKPKKITFYSIGDLNEEEQIYHYSVIEEPETVTEVNLTGVESGLNNVSKSISFSFFWIILFIFVVFPDVISSKMNDNYIVLNNFRIFFLLMFLGSLFFIDFGFTNTFLNLLRLSLVVLIVGLTTLNDNNQPLGH